MDTHMGWRWEVTVQGGLSTNNRSFRVPPASFCILCWTTRQCIWSCSPELFYKVLWCYHGAHVIIETWMLLWMREDSVHYAGMMGIKQHIENCSKPLEQTLELPRSCAVHWQSVTCSCFHTPPPSLISADEREATRATCTKSSLLKHSLTACPAATQSCSDCQFMSFDLWYPSRSY